MSRLTTLRDYVRAAHLADEAECVDALVESLARSEVEQAGTVRRAAALVTHLRALPRKSPMDLFMAQYGLDTDEGVAMMCLAEAILRVPDSATRDALITDKLTDKDWQAHFGKSESTLINIASRAMALTGAVLSDTGASGFRRLIRRLGQPVIRAAVQQAMKQLGRQFVLGETIDTASHRAARQMRKGYTHSFDMLGEAAATEQDAIRYFDAYSNAITALRPQCVHDNIRKNPGISIKLSALYPRYEQRQKERVMDTLVPRLRDLTHMARDANMGLNIDAEEADRLDLSLDIIETVLRDQALSGWDGFGVVVQAYSKRAPAVINWLSGLAHRLDRRIMVRLVKGAYWDSEIRHAQIEGLDGYPVFTRKCATDVSYLACAQQLLRDSDRIYPQFATHNAHTAQAILDMAREEDVYEFQRLHGMGEALFDQLMDRDGIRCRIYAPVGAHDTLLAYLVRRMLENGANASFVNQIMDPQVPAEHVVADPVAVWLASGREPAIPAPSAIYAPERINSQGFDLADPVTLRRLARGIDRASDRQWSAGPRIAATCAPGTTTPISSPSNPERIVGTCEQASADMVLAAIEAARPWTEPMETRAAVLNRAADAYEAAADDLFAVLAREAGKTLPDAVSELREAVDFLRYYATQCDPDAKARGLIAAISPWNFPLAIFTGQIAAALMAGNAVLAKPAEQTPLVAALATDILHAAGVPVAALQLLPGPGADVGEALVADPRIAGVCFTGSTATAQRINRAMAERGNPMAPLIAETGGLNAMIVDSTALAEQAVRDVVASAFQSAGQRCSALRMLYVQEDIAGPFLEMLKGATALLSVGDAADPATDVGPIIAAEAARDIQDYIDAAKADGRVVHAGKTPASGHFVGPTILRVKGIADLGREVFGPVLHICTFPAAGLSRVADEINAAGYGLTFGLHSRLDDRADMLSTRLRVGNIYVNRNQIGAVVGSQPFGGEGLSGTGPKAGGPFYLKRFTRPERADPVAYPTADINADTVQAAIRSMTAASDTELGKLALPGPTGEKNLLTTHPRGLVLCLGPGVTRARQQARMAERAGCPAVVVAPGADAAHEVDGALPLEALRTLGGFAAVALWSDETSIRRARQALAQRDGPILPLITAQDVTEQSTLERHVCTDLTAAGGNMALLSGSDSA